MNIIQKQSSEYLPNISVVEIPVGSTESSTLQTIGDGIFTVNSYESAYLNYQISYPMDSATLSNLTPQICEIENNNINRSLGFFGGGAGTVILDFGTFKKSIVLNFAPASTYTDSKLSDFVSGTNGKFSLSAILNKIDINKSLRYYNGASYAECVANGGIQRNPNCWGADWDFSGVAVFYLEGGFSGGGACITPRHYICSYHYEIRNKVGNILRFCTPDNQVITRTIIAQTTGSELNPQTLNVGDLCVFLLDYPLPSSIKKYSIVGDWAYTSTVVSSGNNIQNINSEISNTFITTNRAREIKFATISQNYYNLTFPYPTTPITIGTNISYIPHTSAGGRFQMGRFKDFTNFQSNAGGGDSGSPVFLPLGNNDLALYTVMTYPNSGTLTHESLLNAMIDEVDARAGVNTNYSVTVAPNPVS
jgi:hypothetical protein